jgi:threonine 3-dehydrogenase
MMKALVKREAGKGIWMEQVPVPTTGRQRRPDQAREDRHLRHRPAHLPVGRVEPAHDQARPGHRPRIRRPHRRARRRRAGYDIGQRVSAEGHIVCGHCRNCRAGRQHLCPNTVGIGVNRAGAFAEYMRCRPATCGRSRTRFFSELAAFFDPYGNAAHCALEFDVIGEDVLITGAGPIGIIAAGICKHIGARNVVVTDVNDYRLKLAADMGATRVVNVSKQSLKDVIKDLHMEGFDVGWK